MIRDNQKIFNRFLVLLDAIVIVVSYLLAWFIHLGGSIKALDPTIGVLGREIYFSALVAIVPGFLMLNNFCELYSPKRTSKSMYEFFNIVKANFAGIIAIMVVLYAINLPDFSRGMMTIFVVINVTLETLMRSFVRKTLRKFRQKGFNQKHILLVGYSRAAESYIDRILDNPDWGYDILGILDDWIPKDTSYKKVRVIGEIDDLTALLEKHDLDEIGITLSLENYDRLEEIVNICEKSGVHTKFVPDYNRVIPSSPYLEDLGGLAVVNIRHVPLTNTGNMILKRLVDIVGGVLAFIVFSPAMLFAIIGIKLSSKGPIIFKQERVGLHNKPFTMYKFRTMTVQTEKEEKKGWTTKNDSRVTKFGKFLRGTSIDELPQLVNVIKGEMSLVGPRPERPQYVEKFKEEIPRYMIKHQVRPGMTGWAQVNGYRGDTSIKKRIEFDLYYIENWTLGFDFKILFLTVFNGFINKNAY